MAMVRQVIPNVDGNDIDETVAIMETGGWSLADQQQSLEPHTQPGGQKYHLVKYDLTFEKEDA